MNKIKGLIIKDILELKAYKKNILFIIAIYMILIYSSSKDSDMSGIGAVMIMMVFTILGINTFHYDDKTKTDRYLLTLPISRKDVVLSKYILSILLMLVGALVGIILGSIFSHLRSHELIDLEVLLSNVLGGMVAVSFISGIQIPFIYKYGVEKGRIAIYVVALIIFIFGNIMAVINPDINMTILDNYEYLIPYICILLSGVIYFVSYKIAYKIYLKKEL